MIFKTTNWLQYYHTWLSTSRFILSGFCTRSFSLLNSHCTTSQLTHTSWASIPLSFLSSTTYVSRESPWPGSRRAFLRNYSLEGPTPHSWIRRRLSSRDIVYGSTDVLGLLSTILHWAILQLTSTLRCCLQFRCPRMRHLRRWGPKASWSRRSSMCA